MSGSLRIAVADDEPKMREYFQEMLTHMGHDVVSIAQTGCQLVEQCRELEPNLVITDIKMPDMDGLDAAEEIYRSGPIPVILVSAFHDGDLLERAERNHILAYLIKPIKQNDLEAAISISTSRFSEFERLREEAADLRQALEDRKVIERAKGILMRKAHLDEQTAFRRLQKLASSKRRKLAEIAQTILTAEEAYDAGEKI